MMDKFEKNFFPLCCLLLILALPLPAQAAITPLGIRFDASYTHDDNVSRSSESKLSDNIFSLNVSKGMTIPISAHTRFALSGLLGAERYATYSGLGRIFGGAQGEFMYRASGEFAATTWALFGRAFVDRYQSALRDGTRFSAGLSARKPVTDRVTFFGAVAKNVRNSKSDVFDTKDTALRMNLDYALTANGTLYIGGEHRRGDIVFSMKSDLAVGDAHQLDDVLTGMRAAGTPLYGAMHLGGGSSPVPQYYSYRMQGKILLATLGYNLAFGSQRSLDFSWRRVESTPDLNSAYSYVVSSYTTNQLSIAYLTSF